ncbi:MAG: aspartate--ammonia ligase [Firmicutes bacterium]|nr:aspartate--ammonia ligase [Candidatus Caballimonas caccae]
MEYKSTLSLLDTEIAIKYIKDNFEKELAKALTLTRVSAPLFVFPETGLNDNLNGYERAVRFDIKSIGKDVEIVQSLAKWKRMALAKYGFKENTGLYTDMNAIRRDEDLDEIHSVYVDQWDWEKIITKEERKLWYLKKTVKSIYKALKRTEKLIATKYPNLKPNLPEEITFVSTKEMDKLFPTLSRKEREDKMAKKYGAVFIYGIGWKLSDGQPHDGRAADYDDWKLNGDILLWNETLNKAFEISSMGIRVDEESLPKQLKAKKETEKLDNPYCKAIMNKELPLTIGGGIGQSRLCMFFLKKAHIGEVQASVWPEEAVKNWQENGINLL